MPCRPEHPELPPDAVSPVRSGGRRFDSVVRGFVVWTMVFFGLFAVIAVCPFCGRPGCSGGALVIGPLGGLVMTLLRSGRSLFRRHHGDARKGPVRKASQEHHATK